MNPMLGAMIGGWEIVLILVALAFVAFWIWMIIDCAVYESSPGARVAWLLVIVLGGIIAAPLYYAVRKLPRYWKQQKPEGTHAPVA